MKQKQTSKYGHIFVGYQKGHSRESGQSSKTKPFLLQSRGLELKPLSSDYALFSNHNRGYADLSKRLWLCMSKHTGVFSHLFLYRFLLKYYIKIHKTLEI